MKQRISAFILSSLLVGLVFLPAKAQEGTAKEAVQAVTDKAAKPALFQGLSLSVEVGTLIARALGGDTFGSEAALRVSIRNKYFPVVELGYGRYDGKNDKTNIQYKTGAPYFRLGADVNMLKNKTQNNRLFLGGRVGFTTYSFDVDGPDIIDPIWHTAQPLHYEGLSSRKLWLELLLGVEAEVFKNFHMGFNLRYK
ncbi:MAG: hypothetical protein HUJ99_01725, partial [Bacteroidaceae bacterium]|nr:hypothetical protein [Bacteroidaceae bacterium]